MRGATVALLSLLIASPGTADEATMREGLVKGCFAGLPRFFEGVDTALRQLGWQSTPRSKPNEHELAKSTTELFVRSGALDDSPLCAVRSGDVTVEQADRILQAEIDHGIPAPGSATLALQIVGGDRASGSTGAGIIARIR